MLTKEDMEAKVEATSKFTTPEQIHHMRVLWQKGRNMFQSFMTEAEKVKKGIGDDKLFADWCFWQLHISITPIMDASAFLKKDDADRVKAEFASAHKAEKDAHAAEAHKLKLEKIAKQNEILEAKLKVAEQKAALKAKLEPAPAPAPAPEPKAKPEKPAEKAAKKPSKKPENRAEQVMRARFEILADPMAKRDIICARAGDVSHGVEQEAHRQLEKEGMVPPRNKGWTKGPPKPDDDMLYTGYVEAGRNAVKHQWTLGDLAIQVTSLKSYGDAKLATYAEDIGIEYATLGGYMSVAKAWPKNCGRPQFSIASTLRSHPHKEAIVAADPAMTVAKARAIMTAWKAENDGKVVNFQKGA
jgi:hypothetical protein